MSGKLQGKKVAILATDGFEQSELTEPRSALEREGATVEVIAPHGGEIQGMRHHDKGDMVAVDRTLDSARPEEYDALMLPGGVANPDALRMEPRAVDFTRSFFLTKKPVAAICHGPWTLVEAGVVQGKRMTSWPSLKTDIGNAGGHWEDAAVVVDHGLVTSRKPGDLPQFCARMIEEIAEGPHEGRQARA
jgi:intracellular protease, PfpI family